MPNKLALLELSPDVRLELPKQGHEAGFGGGARMRLTNVSTHLVAFKLKSTAPKNYAIKPSASTIKRGEVLDVQILRRPPEETESGGGDEETTPAGKTKRPDRFLVQAAVVDTEEKKTLWQAASRGKGQGSSKFWEGVSKDELEERQLEVVLVDANGSAAFHPEPIQEGGGSSGEHGAPSKESKDGNGASGTEDKVSGKGKASKEHGEGKVAKGKKADAKAAKEAGQVADADIDAVIGKVSLPGKAPHEGGARSAPPGFPPPAPPPGFMPQPAGVAQSATPPGESAPSPAAAESPPPGQKSSEDAAVPSRPTQQLIKKPTQKKHEDVVLQKHSRPVTFVMFSPSGKELYTCGKDKLVLAWTAPEGEFIRQYEGHRGAVWACSVSHDGAFLLSCGADSVVMLWEVASAQRLAEVQLTGVARCVDWVPSGERALSGQRHFAACSNNFKDRPAALSVWDTHDTKSEPVQLLIITDLPSPATQVAWCGDSCEVLCSVHGGPAAAEGEVLFWDGRSGAQIGRLEAHSGPTSQVAFARDRNLMASCGRVDMCVRLWDLSTGLSTADATCLQTHNGDRPLNAVALRPSLLRSQVSAAAAGHGGGSCDCLAGGGQDARDVALVGAGTDDQFDPVPLRVGAGEALEAYSLGSDFRAGGHFGPIHALCFSYDGSLCISGSEDGNVRIRDLMVPSSERGIEAPLSPPLPTSLSAALQPPQQQKAKAKPKPEPKTQPKAQPKAQAPKVELATQIPSQPKAQPKAQAGASAPFGDGLSNRVVAVYDFDPLATQWPMGQAHRPLPFRRGQEIEVLHDFGQWALGRVAGNQGLFPMNYVLPMAKYQEIMQRTLLMAKAGSPISSPVSKPSSPPLKTLEIAGLTQLEPKAPSLGMGLGLSGVASGLGAPGMGMPSSLSGGGFGGSLASAGIPPGGIDPGLHGSLGAGLTGGLNAGSHIYAGGPAPSPYLGGGVGGGLAGLGGGLAGGGGLFTEPAEPAAKPGEEEDGDCSQS